MKSGRLLGFALIAITLAFVAMGTAWPNQSGASTIDGQASMERSSDSPQAAVNSLMVQIGRRDWDSAYSSLSNKGEFTEGDLIRDVNGSNNGLRTYADVNGFDVQPLHATADEATMRASLHWASVVGSFTDSREMKVVRTQDRWQVAWPIVKQTHVPPQVLPVNYLRWDVIDRGPGEDWGTQDVEAPHVRIVAMHPVDRGGGVVVLGELLNEDVVPAFVTVRASLLGGKDAVLATADSFDKISHVLLPKQVSPFRIDFPEVRLPQVSGIRIQPSSSLVSASADPVMAIESQKLSPVPDSSLRGELVNQGGQVVNVAHVLGTFYDGNGQILWVADQYPSSALLPQTPEPFSIAIPADVANKVKNYRVVVSTYSSDRLRLSLRCYGWFWLECLWYRLRAKLRSSFKPKWRPEL